MCLALWTITRVLLSHYRPNCPAAIAEVAALATQISAGAALIAGDDDLQLRGRILGHFFRVFDYLGMMATDQPVLQFVLQKLALLEIHFARLVMPPIRNAAVANDGAGLEQHLALKCGKISCTSYRV